MNVFLFACHVSKGGVNLCHLFLEGNPRYLGRTSSSISQEIQFGLVKQIFFPTEAKSGIAKRGVF